MNYAIMIATLYEAAIMGGGELVPTASKGRYAVFVTVPLLAFTIVMIVMAVASGLRALPLPIKEKK